MNRVYNWRPDRPDFRDLRYHHEIMKLAPPLAMPPLTDLRPGCPLVVNQGDYGSCTGNALAGLIGYLELKSLGGTTPESFGANFSPVSRLFIYYNERMQEGTVGQDSGATLRDGINSIALYGVCRESTWAYTPNNVFRKPSSVAYSEASRHRTAQSYRLGTLTEMRHCLSSGFPFVFGFTVYSSFETPAVAKTGIVPYPALTDEVMGGHAVMAVGYDDAKQWLIVRNSWGADWGDKGYFYLPYQYITNGSLCLDFWTIKF